jgi:hypothetical protein
MCTMETSLLTETEKCNHVLPLWSFCDGHTWYTNEQKSEALFYLQEQTAVWSKHIGMDVMLSKWIAKQTLYHTMYAKFTSTAKSNFLKLINCKFIWECKHCNHKTIN